MMTFDDFNNLIMQSSIDDWNIISCWGYGSGPSYKTKFEFYDVWNEEKAILREESHGMYAVYKPDISITIAFGLISNDDFKEKWANSFPDPKASSHYLDLFFKSSLVERVLYVVVDGGRSKLPIPKSPNDLIVSSKDYNLIRLIDSMESGSRNFYDYFERAGLTVENEME